MPANQIHLNDAEIAGFCRKHRIRELRLFGSVLREDFSPDSDVDILVTFEKDVHLSLFELERMQNELEMLIGRKTDMVEKRLVEMSENYIRRNHILQSAVPIYVA